MENLIAVGGGTKNPVWMQIVADIIGRPVCIPKVSIGASYGEALLAALGIGDLKSFSELSSVIEPDRIIMPNAENTKIYEKYLEIYDKLYQSNKELMHLL